MTKEIDDLTEISDQLCRHSGRKPAAVPFGQRKNFAVFAASKAWQNRRPAKITLASSAREGEGE